MQPQPQPDPRGLMRASDADRQKAADAINEAFADGRLDNLEFSDRLEDVWGAKTIGELELVLRDLSTVGLQPTTASGVPMTAAAAHSEHLVAIFSGSERRGEWLVPANMSAMALFGGVDLDFREAAFTSMRVEIQVVAAFGGVDIKIPEGVRVENRMVGILGGTEMKNVGVGDPNAPVLVLSGFAAFGGVTVKGPKRRGRNS